MARIVLVHGAFSGAWVWEPIVDDLRSAGHSVETLDLPGSGDDQTPVEQVTLDAYAEHICAQLGQSDAPAVLVGHSMGGVAITQAAGRCPGRIALLVYVAAFLPQEGQSLLDLTHLPEGEGDQVQANMVVEGEPPVAKLEGEGARIACYGSCEEEEVAWASERMRPQPVLPFTTPVSFADQAGRELPRAYVLCTQDRAIPPALQRRMVTESPCVQVVEINTDHSPWLSASDDLVQALDRLSRQADASAVGTGDVLLSPVEGE
jgi:pimeloyl-ACP methyl ester carboxylesterase